MVSTVFPKILFSQYFWWTIAFALLIAFLFVRKKSPPPFPRVKKSIRKFCKKNEKRITKIGDIFWICMILLMAYFLYFMLSTFRMDFSVLSESKPIRTKFIKSDRWFIFSTLIIWSGISGFFVGFLSFFQSNITKIKRIILLIVCMFPIVFMVIQVLINAVESFWWTIELCLFFSAGSWIINMPAVLVGKSTFELLEGILKKLKLIPSHHAD
jgi:hypothetical protein